MSINCACSSVSASSCRSTWIEPDIDASGLRISCAMPAAISPTAASRCCRRSLALEPPQVGDVLEGEAGTRGCRPGAPGAPREAEIDDAATVAGRYW
jgi:hypothetical protein